MPLNGNYSFSTSEMTLGRRPLASTRTSLNSRIRSRVFSLTLSPAFMPRTDHRQSDPCFAAVKAMSPFTQMIYNIKAFSRTLRPFRFIFHWPSLTEGAYLRLRV